MLDLINYSIIIPHFRVAGLLERAICSIPAREDVEVIVVDDNSGDDYTAELKSICSKRAEQVRLILLQENGGGGKARNIGMKAAQGKWVVFLDADDMFNYCINAAIDEYKDSDADIVFFKASSIDSETYLPLNRAVRVNGCVDDALKGNHNNYYELRYHQGCPVAKFVKRDFLIKHDIWFEEIRKHNDVRFAYTSGHYAQKIVADPRAIYCITSRGDSVSADASAEARLLRVKVCADFIQFKLEHDIAIDDEQLLFNTMAEIYEKDKTVYEKGIEIIRQTGLEQEFIEKRLNRALRNMRVRKLLPVKVRKIINKVINRSN